ncbi:hypothetical protein PM082_011174 [Marasmius tenuissimus]|nr:hypothetical protein PM082_011174 [Marasmius tenuissimus]
MVDEKKSLTESAAGSQLDGELREQEVRRGKLKKIREEIAAVDYRDATLQKELEDETETLR